MKLKLPNPTFLAVVATVAGVLLLAVPLGRSRCPAITANETPENPTNSQEPLPTNGQALLERAILVLEQRPFVSANLRHHGDLFGQKLIGKGIYQQQRSDPIPLFRMELTTRVGDQPSSMVNVCDGIDLWMYRKLPHKGPRITHVDVERVRRVLEETGQMSRLRAVGNWPGLGGLPKILRGLHASFDFSTPELTRLSDRFPVWRLQGHWKPKKLGQLLPDQKEAIDAGKPADLSRLAPHLPDHVLLFLGKQDLLPYRVEYRRREPNGQAETSGSHEQSIVTLELFEVDVTNSIPEARFQFPRVPDYSEKTDSFLETLRLEP